MTFKKLRRAFCLVLALCLLLSFPAFAAAMGDELMSYTLDSVREGTDYRHSVYWTGSDYCRENIIEYSPNTSVFPVVVYGSKLLNYGSFASMAKLLNEEGYYVIGGINGDYYNTWDFQPLGVVVKDGRLISSDGGFVAVGFRDDGSAFIGKPGITAAVELYGETYQLDGINKARQADFTLYTPDYSAETGNTEPGWDIILAPRDDTELTVNCTMKFIVEEIIESEGSCAIPEGKMLLSLPKSSDEWRTSSVEALSAGDVVRLTVSCADGWDEAAQCIGTLYQLIDDGEISTDLPVGTGPRTAVGTKPDGTVLFYTVDGRNPGHSVGATAEQTARRLSELGCTDAVLMDGGGSTTMNMVLPGERAISQINTPSDGKQRSVTNYIMLVSTEPPTGEASRLVLSPYRSNLLLGAKLPLTVKATDSVGFAAAVPETAVFSSAMGTFEDNIFTATHVGRGKISVSADGLTGGEAGILVVDTPDTITVKDSEGTAYTTIKIIIGESIDLTASAVYNHLELIAQDSCFKWGTMGNIGSIDETGCFTAGEKPAEGFITVSAGERAAKIGVKVVYPPGIYSDVSEADWYYDSVKILGEKGFMNGITDTEFAPAGDTTRAMLVTLLYRLEGAPAVSTVSSFEDVEADSWYSDAVSWASENGLVTGYDEKTFGSFDSITREQMATLLCRYAAWSGTDTAVDASLEHFEDLSSISSWAADAVKWCVDMELIRGITDTSFDPHGTASRGQIAVLLDRYIGG